MPSCISFFNFSVLVMEKQKKHILNYYSLSISNWTKNSAYNKIQRKLKKLCLWEYHDFAWLIMPDIQDKMKALKLPRDYLL